MEISHKAKYCSRFVLKKQRVCSWKFSSGIRSEAHISTQIDILNQAYNTSGFSFVLNSTTRTTSAAWQNLQYQSSVEIAMKKNLRVGTYKDLNIYFSTLAPDGNGHHLLGYAYVFSISHPLPSLTIAEHSRL